MTRSGRRAIALALTIAFLSGCFSYVPTQLGAVQEGAVVRVHLSPAAQVQLTQRVGRRIEDSLDGTLTGRQPSQLMLKVPIAAQQEGFFRGEIAQDIQIAEPDVLGIDVRRFSHAKTALLVGGAAAGAGALIAFIVSNSKGGSVGPGGGIEEIRIPLASFGTR